MSWFRNTLLNKNFWLGVADYQRVPSELTATIVIPAYNEENFIRATIESILDQDHPCKVIVVNDSSTDRTPDIVREYPGVKLITTTSNQGSKSMALNYSIPYIKTDIFICVDADTVLAPDAVGKLLMAFNNPRVMVASGYVKSKEGPSFWENGRSGEYVLGQSLFKSAQSNVDTVMVASGCFFAIKTHFLADHHFNDRTMAEDMDLTWVAIEAGYSVMFVQDAFCTVSDPTTRAMYANQVSRWYRGFFQNLKVRGYDLFSKNPKLGITAYFYMLFNLIGTPLFIMASIYSVHQEAVAVPIFGLVVFVLICAYTMIYGWLAGDRVLKYPWFLLCSMLLNFYSYFLYVKSMIQELVLNDRLNVWIKGH